MKKLWNYLVQHVREDFHPAYYGAVVVFIAICISLNFTFDIEDSYIDTRQGISRFMAYFVAHSIAYYIPVLLLTHILSPKKFSLTKEFWVRSTVALALLSLDRSDLLLDILLQRVDYTLQYFAMKVLNNLSGLVIVILPLYILYKLRDRSHNNFYGLHVTPYKWRPYIQLLALVIPLLAIASFSKGFQIQYPMYVETNAFKLLNIPKWVTVIAYEIAYAINFVSVEFFYRGFMVLGMAAILGRSSILPMACLYCFLHFGKPLPEAISSIFGGYILGVVSYETRSIWGGIAIHIGIAWSMEILAAMHKL